MKSLHYLASFAILTVVLSASSFAKDKDSHSGSFTLSDTARVGSTDLAPGSYKVEWNGPANDVKINILQAGKTVATAEGHIESLPQRAPYGAVTVKTLDNNTKVVDEIEFGNRSEALQIGE
jgi:hypothetical protein